MEEREQLQIITLIRCHLKCGKVIEYYQLENVDSIIVMEKYMNVKDNDVIELTYVDDPNNCFSTAHVLKKEIAYFENTHKSFVQLPDCFSARNGVIQDWYWDEKIWKSNK